jgi:hypothetical protein
MSITFRQICEGERDWTALGNFMNYWYAYAKDRRAELIADPLPEYDETSLYQHRWAVFCAASVEWFCNKYAVPCPSWVHDAKYTLSEPWFFYQHEPVKSRLLQTTPEEFTRRNVFCGDNSFANKWEFIDNWRNSSVYQQKQKLRMPEEQV